MRAVSKVAARLSNAPYVESPIQRRFPQMGMFILKQIAQLPKTAEFAAKQRENR
jgi:hypothetical protein